MLFNSYIFLFLFFPLCLLGFYGFGKRSALAAKIWLIGFSLWFYGYFHINYLGIMLFSILFNYAIYHFMCEMEQYKRGILIGGVVVNLAVLFYFKYYDFFIGNINALTGSSFVLRNILLPLGISFFTFQQISFLTDTYRGNVKECSFVDYALFVSFFPQLIAGPIVTQEEMLPQFRAIGQKRWDAFSFSQGLYIFVLGMCKKVLVADTFGKAVDAGYSLIGQGGAPDAWLTMLFYTLQLYFDFSGYCDMAIGIGRMFLIEIPVNFNSPYKAGNIIDFWKRWHMTLSRFFMQNVYIPLGGNKKGSIRMYANLFLVFFLSGLWHGAGWTFLVWGIMHGILYCITRAVMRMKQKNKPHQPSMIMTKIRHVSGVFLTFLFVNAAWVFFRSDSIKEACLLLKQMVFGTWQKPAEAIAEAFNLDEFWYLLKVVHLTDFSFSRYLFMMIITVVSLMVVFFGRNVQELAKKWKPSVGNAVLTAFLLVWCIVSFSGVSTFLYFNF